MAVSVIHTVTQRAYQVAMADVFWALVDAYAVGKILYPGQFKDLDPKQKADEIYRFLVGKPVYQQMEKDYVAVGHKAPFLQ